MGYFEQEEYTRIRPHEDKILWYKSIMNKMPPVQNKTSATEGYEEQSETHFGEHFDLQFAFYENILKKMKR